MEEYPRAVAVPVMEKTKNVIQEAIYQIRRGETHPSPLEERTPPIMVIRLEHILSTHMAY